MSVEFRLKFKFPRIFIRLHNFRLSVSLRPLMFFKFFVRSIILYSNTFWVAVFCVESHRIASHIYFKHSDVCPSIQFAQIDVQSFFQSRILSAQINGRQNTGCPILADLPTYPRPIWSDFGKPTYLPKNRTSYVDGP